MNRAHLVPTALAFVAGVAGDTWGIALPLLSIAVTFAIVARAASGVVRANVLGALALGVAYGAAFAHFPRERGDAHVVRLEIVIADTRATADGRFQSTVRLPGGSLATLDLPDAPPVGTRLVVTAKRAPFDDARNPGEPSLRAIEAERGVAWHLVHARILARAPPDPTDASLWIARARAAASRRLHATLGEPDATLLAGAMWGERGPLPPALRAEFQDTGTVHVLVTAGLHLGVVGGIALGTLRAMRFGRTSAALIAMAVVWAYAVFSGAHLPSLRAATMLSFALLAHASGRPSQAWNALAAAAIVVTLVRPTSVTTLSFALSFSCVAAIFAFAPPIARGCEGLGLPHAACEALGVTFATQLGTWPLTAAAFLVIAPYAPLANLLVVPIVGVAMLVGFVTPAATPVPPLAALGANVATSLCDWIVAVVRWTGTLPGAHVIATPPPIWTIAAYDVACAFAAVALARDRVRVACATLTVASSLCLWPPRAPSHDLVVSAIDVGQADAILIRTPAGRAILVDAGGRLERGTRPGVVSNAEDVGERTVVPFLVRDGVHHLDAVLLSHPHGDHKVFDAQ
ncbi:MAG: hypothetical protein NVS2B8_04340 [Vulcanimicrobiaceae bacterium]